MPEVDITSRFRHSSKGRIYNISDSEFFFDHFGFGLGGLDCFGIVGFALHRTTNLDIEFNFGLCAGGADGNLRAVGSEVL